MEYVYDFELLPEKYEAFIQCDCGAESAPARSYSEAVDKAIERGWIVTPTSCICPRCRKNAERR